jgi:hypothetical protein
MDTTSIVTSHRAPARGKAGLRDAGARLPPKHGTDDGSVANHPIQLDFAAHPYQASALVTLDLAPEVERPKAALGTLPTTT